MTEIAPVTVGRGYEKNLTIPQGYRFLYVIAITGLDMSSLTPKMQIRKGDKTTTAYLDASSYITIDNIQNQIVVDIPGSATSTATWRRGRYDLMLYDNTNSAVSPVCVIRGQVYLDPEVTV